MARKESVPQRRRSAAHSVPEEGHRGYRPGYRPGLRIDRIRAGLREQQIGVALLAATPFLCARHVVRLGDLKRAAQLLDISERSLRALAASGAIKKVYIGSMPRYAVSELEQLASKRTPPRKKRRQEVEA